MKHRFKEGDTVLLNDDRSIAGLSAGTAGVVWCLYDTQPPSYEITFSDTEGRAFDATLSEEELSAPIATENIERQPITQLR
jgi:hypothetical protein